jgi:hypothetical protein
MMKYDFRCYGCKSKLEKMVDNNEEQYLCGWNAEWETVENPALQEFLNCGGYGPVGYECAFFWTRIHQMVEGEEPMTVIACLLI